MTSQPFDELNTGWLSPEGIFYPCEPYNHLYLADRIYKTMFYKIYDDYEIHEDTEEKLKKLGWVKICIITYLDHGFIFDFYNHLTAEQIHTIKPIVENNLQRIIKSNRQELIDEFER